MSVAKNPACRLNSGTEMPAVGLGVFRSEPETTVAAVRIPKSVRAERITENIDIFDFTLTQHEVASVTALDTGERGGWDPDDVTARTFQ